MAHYALLFLLRSGSMTDERRKIVHFGPDISEPGGIGSVIRESLSFDLDSWDQRAVATYSGRGSLARLQRLIHATWSASTLSRRRTAGVHVHMSQNFDLVRSL